MTLADLVPTLRSSLYSRLESGLWPSTARSAPGGGVTVGGVGLDDVAARAGAAEFDLPGLAHRVHIALSLECTRHAIARPRLTFEPGRAIVGRAGVTVYRVAVVKQVGDGRRMVAIDGGMSDNPRPALYGARYPVRIIGRAVDAALRPATVVGRHCESGDLLAEDVPLPDDVHAGDLLAVPCSGAYHYSMASNYNLVTRPPVVGVADGHADLLVRRETEEDLLRRDIG